MSTTKELLGRQMGDQTIDAVRLRGLAKQGDLAGCKAVTEKLLEAASLEGMDDVLYDVSPAPGLKGVKYTEVFASMGGIFLTARDPDRQLQMLMHAVTERCTVDHTTQIARGLQDKYELLNYEMDYPQKVVILPGSNLLEQCVDKMKLNSAVSQGAYIKPHPMTKISHREIFSREYGAVGKLLPPMYSGNLCVRNADVVYTSGSSELALLAVILGKKILDVGNGNITGGYCAIWKVLNYYVDKHKYLNRMIGSRAGGIFFPHNTVEDIREWFRLYREVFGD